MGRKPNSTAKVKGLYIGEGKTLLTTTKDKIVFSLEGIVGDKHAGFTRKSCGRTPWIKRGTLMRNSRQVTVVSEEEMAVVATNLGLSKLDPAWIGANILVSGIPDFTKLPIGARLTFSDGSTLICMGENNPCRHAGAMIKEMNPEWEGKDVHFPKAAIGLRGILATVELAGGTKIGDEMKVFLP